MTTSRYKCLAGTVILVVSLAACSGRGDGQLTNPLGGGPSVKWTGDQTGTGDFGVDMSDVGVGRTVAFGSIVLCVEGGDQAAVTGVRFKTARNIAVQHFALRRVGQFQLGAEQGSIAKLGFDLRDTKVLTRCGSNQATPSELGIDVASTAPGTAEGQNLVVQYRAGDRNREVVVPMTIRLCPQKECASKA